MDTNTLILISIAVAVLIVAGIVAWFALRWRRSQKFGPEYDYTMKKVGDRHLAEETLAERQKRVNELEIRALEPVKRDRYHTEWIEIQAGFVDEPSESVEEADRLITEVMIARGFPLADFEHRAADISVVYPDFVSNYRNAHNIAEESQRHGVSTEELRQAMVYYRSVVAELLGIEENNVEEKVKEVIIS